MQALGEGYFGLNTAFIVNIVMVLVLNGLVGALKDNLAVLGLSFVVVLGVVFGMTFKPNQKIGEGLNWAPWGAILASTLMAINSALCCGIIGYLVVQSMASKELEKYGVKKSFIGLKKSDFKAAVERRKQEGATPNAPSGYSGV